MQTIGLAGSVVRCVVCACRHLQIWGSRSVTLTYQRTAHRGQCHVSIIHRRLFTGSSLANYSCALSAASHAKYWTGTSSELDATCSVGKTQVKMFRSLTSVLVLVGEWCVLCAGWMLQLSSHVHSSLTLRWTSLVCTSICNYWWLKVSS